MNFSYKNSKYNMLPTFDECIDSLSRRFNDAEEKINRLQEENKKLKEEHYKDEELQRLKTENEILKLQESLGFPITKEEDQKVLIWRRFHTKQHHKVSPEYVWSFYPTSLGTVGLCKCCSCGAEFIFKNIT